MSDSLATYLHDHLAGSKMAINLLGALRDQYDREELGRFAEEILGEVEEDRDLLESVAKRIGSPGGSIIKEAGAWLTEKGFRLKLGTPADALGTLEALEVLALGIQGKLALWRSLEQIADPRLQDLDLEELASRARSQHSRMEQRRLQAARTLQNRNATSSVG